MIKISDDLFKTSFLLQFDKNSLAKKNIITRIVLFIFFINIIFLLIVFTVKQKLLFVLLYVVYDSVTNYSSLFVCALSVVKTLVMTQTGVCTYII